MRVLIIDDDKHTVRTIKRTITMYFPDISIVSASSLIDAKKIISQGKVDLILVDYFLGNETGLSIVKETNIPTVIISSSGRVINLLSYSYTVIDKANGYLSDLKNIIHRLQQGKSLKPTATESPERPPKRLQSLLLKVAQIEYETEKIVGGQHAKRAH